MTCPAGFFGDLSAYGLLGMQRMSRKRYMLAVSMFEPEFSKCVHRTSPPDVQIAIICCYFEVEANLGCCLSFVFCV